MSPTIAKVEDERLNDDFYLLVYFNDLNASKERNEVITEILDFKLNNFDVDAINKNHINNVKVLHTAGRSKRITLEDMVRTKLHIAIQEKNKDFSRVNKK